MCLGFWHSKKRSETPGSETKMKYAPSSWIYDGKLVWRTEGQAEFLHIIAPGEEIRPDDKPFTPPPRRKHSLRDWM